MESEIQKCELCKRSGSTINQYKFYYGCVTSSPGGRQLFFDRCPGAASPAYVHKRIEGGKEAWICDNCIRRERLSDLRSNIKYALTTIVIYLVVGILLYYYWEPIIGVLKIIESSYCCACIFVVIGGFIVLGLLCFSLAIVCSPFTRKSKEEIGDSLAIKIHRDAIRNSVNWINPEPKIINGIVLEPRRVMGFWTRKQKKTEKFP